MSSTFPEVDTYLYNQMTDASVALKNFLLRMNDRPQPNLARRCEFYRKILNGEEESHDDELEVELIDKKDEFDEWIDPDLLMDVDEPIDSPNGKDEEEKNEKEQIECEIISDDEEEFISVEQLTEEIQTQLLDLKAALHNQETSVEVQFILDLQDDELSCVANDLSKLSSSQISTVLKSFLAIKENRMLQRDLGLWFRYFLLDHLNRMSSLPDALLLSCGDEIATRWPTIFIENVVLPSMKTSCSATVSFVNRTLKSLGAEHLANSCLLLLRQVESSTAKTAEVDAALDYCALIVSNGSPLGGELLTVLCSVYRIHENRLCNHRVFAKLTLEIVKRIDGADMPQTALSEILSSLNHPLKNIIKKFAAKCGTS